MTDGRGVEEEEEEVKEMKEVRGTMRYGSQKIRDPDVRARHVSRRINEGAWALLRPSSSCLPVSRAKFVAKVSVR